MYVLLYVFGVYSGSLPQPVAAVIADKFFHPFELACHCGVPKIINTALDCIQVSTAL